MPRSPGPRGAYAKTPKRREEILDAAFDVFARYGYLNSSMSEIAKRAGMTMPGVTHHFPDEVRPARSGAARARPGCREPSRRPARGRLLRGLLEIAERDEHDRGLTQLFAILSAEATIDDHPAHGYFRDRYDLILRNVRRAFEEAAGRRELRPGVIPAEAAQMYVALSDGLQLQRLYAVNRVRQAALTRLFLESVLVDPSLRGMRTAITGGLWRPSGRSASRLGAGCAH